MFLLSRRAAGSVTTPVHGQHPILEFGILGLPREVAR